VACDVGQQQKSPRTRSAAAGTKWRTASDYSRRRTRGGRRRITTEDAHVDPSRFAATVSTWRVMTNGSSRRTGVDQRQRRPRGERRRTTAEDKHAVDGGRSARHEHVVARKSTADRQTNGGTAAADEQSRSTDDTRTNSELLVYYSSNNHVLRRQPEQRANIQ